MAPRPPSDAIVALRSLNRRAKGLFAGLGDDEAPDDLAHRNGADGRSALDELGAATRTIALLGRAIEQVLESGDPMLHPAVADAAARSWPAATGSVDEILDELGREADRLADRLAHVDAGEWARAARVAGHDLTTTPLAILWDAVDSGVAHLRAAEQTLAQVRGRS